MEKTEGFAEPNEFKTILVNFTREKMIHGTHQDTILVATQAVMVFVQEMIEQLEASGQSPAVSCGSGCSFCCHSLIKVIPAEALLIESFIRHHFIDSDIQVLKKKIYDYQILVDGKSLKKRVLIKDQTPCIFLKNSICRIYPVRPFICRAWNSLDRSACQSAFRSANHNAEIEASPVRNFIFGTAREIFQEMDSQMALETGLYKIPGAILDCLSHTDSLKRWCMNEPVFTNVN
ncbi:YkgJ family cysteine cluster protein [Desulfobacula sp.]|nr:YkgJ family cysteine cluster protein [Desulfobacula sp.]